MPVPITTHADDWVPFDFEPRPDPAVTDARQAEALRLARIERAADVAKDHERDLADLHLGLMTEAEYRRAEIERDRYVSEVKVFFNPREGEYCIEDHPYATMACPCCGIVSPGDPCEGCGKVQPLSCDDYYHANTRVLLLPDPAANALGGAPPVFDSLPF